MAKAPAKSAAKTKTAAKKTAAKTKTAAKKSASPKTAKKAAPKKAAPKPAAADPLLGKKAPAFAMARDGGGKVALKDYKDRTLVLYFYPKDDTPGCTKEAIGFTQAADKFAKAGAAIVGVSKDTAAKHDKFKEKHGLGITLASDAEGDVTERFGAWVEKNMYGKKYMGIDRSTFLIDGKGVIRKVWRKVKVPGHVEEVLEAVKAL